MSVSRREAAAVIHAGGREADYRSREEDSRSLVEVRGGGLSDQGYSHGSYGSAYVTKERLADIVENRRVLSAPVESAGYPEASPSL